MKESKRNWIQAAAALLQNAHLSGFVTGEISTGAGKQVCVPGLNCYSCPGAVGACPIGSLQAVLSGGRRGFSYYVTGMVRPSFGITITFPIFPCLLMPESARDFQAAS